MNENILKMASECGFLKFYLQRVVNDIENDMGCRVVSFNMVLENGQGLVIASHNDLEEKENNDESKI